MAWQNSIHLDLLGTETRFYHTANYTTRSLEVANDKQPLFLLHGGGGHAETYSRNLNALAKVCQPMALDFIWHGQSSAPPFANGSAKDPVNWLRQFTLQMLEIMDHLQLDKVAIEGESLGGWIALDLAVNYPDRVSAIVLNTAWGIALDPSVVPEGDADLDALKKTSLEALEHPTDETLRKRLEWLMPLGGVTDELVQLRKALWAAEPTHSALKEYYERLFAPDIASYYFDEQAIASITCPTLVLWTDQNPIHGPDAAHRLHQLVPHSDLHIMAGCAHWPQWERPEEHDRVVGTFMSKLDNGNK